MRAIGSAVDPMLASDNLGYQNYSAKIPVDPRLVDGESTGIFLVAGQSFVENSIQVLGPPDKYTPTSTRVHALSIWNGGMYRATDPQVGASSDGGSMMGRLGQKLIDAGTFQRVILVSFGVGGTTIQQWDVGGGLHWRWIIAQRRLAALGLTATGILWEQGTANAIVGVVQSDWTDPFHSMVDAVRSYGLTCPWFVAQSTIPGYASFAPAQVIRAAQLAVLDGVNLIYAGGDTDSIALADRNPSDHLHMAISGAGIQADHYKDAIAAVF